MHSAPLTLVLALAASLQWSARPVDPSCRQLPGVDSLLSLPELNHVLIGEYHGTVEMPAVAADIMCAAAARGRPVVLGVEFTPDHQRALDHYLHSDGGAQAREALLATPIFQGTDPRATQAVFSLLDDARRLAASGHRIQVVAFDRVPHPMVSREREAALAEELMAARQRLPGSLVVALTGVGHAGKTPWTSQQPPFPSTGQLMQDGTTVALAFARHGGRYFACHDATPTAPAGCDTQEMPVREPLRPRGIVLDASLREGFEGVYSAGTPWTASGPARSEQRRAGRE